MWRVCVCSFRCGSWPSCPTLFSLSFSSCFFIAFVRPPGAHCAYRVPRAVFGLCAVVDGIAQRVVRWRRCVGPFLVSLFPCSPCVPTHTCPPCSQPLPFSALLTVVLLCVLTHSLLRAVQHVARGRVVTHSRRGRWHFKGRRRPPSRRAGG